MTSNYAVKGTSLTINTTVIGQIQSIDTVSMQVGKRDVTHLLSAAKEYAPSIGDPQPISFTVIFASTDNGAQPFFTKANTPSSTLDSFSVIFSTTTKTITFSGFPSKASIKFGDVEGTVMLEGEIQPSGSITFPTT